MSPTANELNSVPWLYPGSHEGIQLVAAALPGGDSVDSGHGEHSCREELYESAGHGSQSTTLLTTALYVPGSQAVHTSIRYRTNTQFHCQRQKSIASSADRALCHRRNSLFRTAPCGATSLHLCAPQGSSIQQYKSRTACRP